MYDCVTGVQIENYFGCIMADEMVRLFFFLNENQSIRLKILMIEFSSRVLEKHFNASHYFGHYWYECIINYLL